MASDASASQPTGTGFIDPFVRIQMTGTERGYNTDGQIEFDTKDNGGHNWTHSLLLSDLNAVTVNGTQYFRISLDINEQGNAQGALISMNDFRLYLGNAGNLTGWNDGFGANSVKVYDIDSPGNNVTVELDNSLNSSGSGDKDMDVFIPVSLFQGHPGFNYVYLYSSFGNPNGSDAGFEEWWAELGQGPNPPPPVVPAPPSVILAGIGVLGFGALARLRRRHATTA